MPYEQPDPLSPQLWQEIVIEHVTALLAQDTEADKGALQAKAEQEKEAARRAGKRAEDEKEESLRRIVLTPATAIDIERTRWLWRDRIPLGGLGLVAGKGDVSKSTLFAQMVAWITTGDMKGEFYGYPQNVLYVVNEDSMSQTVVPRMIAHGADMSRVFFVKTESPLGVDALSLPRDTDLLRESIMQSGAVCTFIDPLSANVTGRANDSRDTRSTYQAVNNLAEVTDTSILGLAHTRKAGAADVMEAILGSSEQGNVARSVHGLVMDDEETGARILSCEKLNVGQRHELASLRFTVVSHNVHCTNGEWTSAPRIEWLEETTDTASDMLADRLEGSTKAGEARVWLASYLQKNGGQAYAHDVYKESPREFNDRMMRRALEKLRGRSYRQGDGRSLWYHPSALPQ